MVVLSVFCWCSFPIQIHGYILNILHTHTQWIPFIVISAFTLVEIAISALKKTIVFSWWYQAPDIMCVAWIHLDSNFCCFNPQCCFAITTCLHGIPYAPDLNSRFLHFKLLLSSCTFQIYHPLSCLIFEIQWIFLLGNLPYFTPAAPSFEARSLEPLGLWTSWGGAKCYVVQQKCRASPAIYSGDWPVVNQVVNCQDLGYGIWDDMGMDQYLLIPFLVGWTSIYQLFWCSPGVQGFDTLPFGRIVTGIQPNLRFIYSTNMTQGFSQLKSDIDHEKLYHQNPWNCPLHPFASLLHNLKPTSFCWLAPHFCWLNPNVG